MQLNVVEIKWLGETGVKKSSQLVGANKERLFGGKGFQQDFE